MRRGSRQSAVGGLPPIHRGRKSAEVSRRAERLLAALAKKDGPPRAGLAAGEPLRTLRVIHALERVGTRAARAALRELAADDAEERETREAREALARLERRDP